MKTSVLVAIEASKVKKPADASGDLYTSVLVALDGSHLAAEALLHGMAIARSFGATLVLLHVLPARDGHHLEAQDSTREQDVRRSQAEAYLEGLKSSLGRNGVRVDWLLEEGPAADTIIRVAGCLERPLLVLAQVGRTASRSAAIADGLGEVAEEVMTEWDGPLLLVKPRA